MYVLIIAAKFAITVDLLPTQKVEVSFISRILMPLAWNSILKKSREMRPVIILFNLKI